MNLKSFSSRWLWLAAGIVAIISLTGLNVYSLYQLRSRSIESIQKSKILQVAEFAERTRQRFFYPFEGPGTLNIKKMEQTLKRTGRFTDYMIELVYRASKDSIYEDFFYVSASSSACYDNQPILVFNEQQKRFVSTRNYDAVVCDAVGMARTRMRALIDGYQFNNKVLFDTHRSMTIALVNLSTQSVVGYLVMPINQSFLINEYLQPQLVKHFGGEKETGITVWLRYWTKQKVLANSDPRMEYDPDLVQYVHQFPDFFDDWRLYVSMDEALLAASNSNSFLLNIIVLAIGFIFLIGALIFMFITAQRERDLAKRQSSFLANVTHELKTPLAVMQAAGENLSDGRIGDKNRLQKYGSHIYSEALRLRQMIEKLLDVAKADAGQSFVKPSPCSVDVLTKNYIEEHWQYIKDCNFYLEVNIQEEMPQALIDEHNFYTILNNLINNAIKYSPKEKFLKINLSSTEKNIILEIEDRGIGMDSKTLNHAFEKFYRAEDSLTAQTKGHGLGLPIVKNLVELNNSTIEVESEKGQGSVFTIRFPIITNTNTKKVKKHEHPIANEATAGNGKG